MNSKTKQFCTTSLCSSALALILLYLPFSSDYQSHMYFIQGRDFLADFLNPLCSLSIAKGFNPYHYWSIAASEQIYPPFAYAIMMPFVCFMPESATSLYSCYASRQATAIGLIWLCCMTFSTLAALIIAARKYGASRILYLTIALSGIVLFSLERGNQICLALLGITIFLCHYDDNRPSKKIVAAIGLALSVALKVTPVLFCVVWFNRKDFRYLLAAGVITIAISLLPLLATDHSIVENAMQLLSNVTEHERQYTLYSLSINPACVLTTTMGSIEPSIITIVKWSSAIIGLVGLFIAARGIIPKWQILFLLAASQVLMSTAPQQYVTIFFIPSLFAFLSEEQHVGRYENILFLVVFLILTTPIQLCIASGISMNFIFLSEVILLGTVYIITTAIINRLHPYFLRTRT